MSDFVGNPEDRFSHNEAQIIPLVSIFSLSKVSLIDELDGYHANRPTNQMFRSTSETEGKVIHVILVYTRNTSLTPPPL